MLIARYFLFLPQPGQNYGEFFDLGPEGIAGGPVQLTDNRNATTIDLSSNTWRYKVVLESKGIKIPQLHSILYKI